MEIKNSFLTKMDQDQPLGDVLIDSEKKSMVRDKGPHFFHMSMCFLVSELRTTTQVY